MEVLVVGAGVVGLSAAHELGRAGHNVRVVSADPPGSVQSAGLSRIFRLAHADAGLTEAAAQSLELWERWEEEAGAPLLDRTGLLLTGDMSDREPHLARFGGLEALTGRSHPLAVAHDRWLLERTGAALRAEATLRFLQADGFEVVLDEVVGVDRGAVTLAGGSRLTADRVLVCAGPQTYDLVGIPAPARRRSVRFSFAVREPDAASAPCWIQRDERLSEPFYAVPDGPDHYSVGISHGEPAETPEAAHVRSALERTVALVRHLFPGLVPIADRAIACEYPTNPAGPLSEDGWHLLGREGVLGLTGPALFKFAPLLAAIAVEAVSGG